MHHSSVIFGAIVEPGKIPKDLLDALAEFDNAATQIVTSLLKSVESRETPKVIYHYTNDVGLRGILQTGQFWLSDIFNLNDPSELSHGFSHAVNILNSKAAAGPLEIKQFARHFADFHQYGMEMSAHYFVCAFSADGDDLGQWRAYADNGRGYALGFDAKALEDAFTKKNGSPIPNNCTFHVRYDDAELAAIHRKLIEHMFGLISLPQNKGLERSIIHAYMRDLSISLSLQVLRSSLFFKHQAYKNEQEYRFMQIHRADLPPPEVKRRYRSYELIKHREFDWRGLCAGALKQVSVGPAADRSKAVRFAGDCLREFHAGDVEITRSGIPYRAV